MSVDCKVWHIAAICWARAVPRGRVGSTEAQGERPRDAGEAWPGEAGGAQPVGLRGEADPELTDGCLQSERPYVLIRAIIFRIET